MVSLAACMCFTRYVFSWWIYNPIPVTMKKQLLPFIFNEYCNRPTRFLSFQEHCLILDRCQISWPLLVNYSSPLLVQCLSFLRRSEIARSNIESGRVVCFRIFLNAESINAHAFFPLLWRSYSNLSIHLVFWHSSCHQIEKLWEIMDMILIDFRSTTGTARMFCSSRTEWERHSGYLVKN